MRAAEFIIEDWGYTKLTDEQLLLEGKVLDEFIGRNGVRFHVTDHYYDRLHDRGRGHIVLSPEYALPFLLKVGKTRKHMVDILPRTQFYVWDHESEIVFGLRRLSDDRDGRMNIFVGTVLTPKEDGSPARTYDDGKIVIHMA